MKRYNRTIQSVSRLNELLLQVFRERFLERQNGGGGSGTGALPAVPARGGPTTCSASPAGPADRSPPTSRRRCAPHLLRVLGAREAGQAQPPVTGGKKATSSPSATA